MKLTNENYYSQEANDAYMSVSQFKTFLDCEMLAMAQIEGRFQREETTALLVGSYVDAHFSKELDLFKAKHPGIFTRSGELKSEFLKANEIIARIERDDLFMRLIGGASQEIRTGSISGVPFKIKMDSLLSAEQCQEISGAYPELAQALAFADGAIVDMKIMRDFEPIWVPGEGKLPFIQAWRYDLQLAVYQAIEGRRLPCFIAAATKEKTPDIAVYAIPQEEMDRQLMLAEELAPRFQAIKDGNIAPDSCGKCDWCKSVKTLERAIDYLEEADL